MSVTPVGTTTGPIPPKATQERSPSETRSRPEVERPEADAASVSPRRNSELKESTRAASHETDKSGPSHDTDRAARDQNVGYSRAGDALQKQEKTRMVSLFA